MASVVRADSSHVLGSLVAPTTPDDMKERIRRACTEITLQMLAEVRGSFHQRINKCLQVEGHHFEHLL